MKLLVTTDFSTNSKGAIRFAQTLTKKSGTVEVVFYHAIHITQPTRWSDVFFQEYETEEIERLTKELKRFASNVLGNSFVEFLKVSFVVENCVSSSEKITVYAKENQINYICISTEGAGMLRKIIGTHTSYIVNNSEVPVIVVPSSYRTKLIKNATYLSDFENIKREIAEISTFSDEIIFDLEVLHYSTFAEDTAEFEEHKKLFNAKEFEKFTLNVQDYDLEFSLVEKIEKHVEKSKPDLLIMFTKHNKGFFDRIFLPSKSASLSYTTKVPVLIFSK